MIKALRGDIYGESVRDIIQCDALMSAKPTTLLRSIKCRFQDGRQVLALVSVLRVDYHVHQTGNCDDEIIVTLNGTCESMHGRICIQPTTILRNLWRLIRPTFDVDTLACNHNSIYVYTVTTPNEPVDNISAVMSRILSKRFSLLHLDIKNTPTAIPDAIRMVHNGWSMDAKVLGPKSWIVSTWKDVQGMRSNECTICQESFRPTDIVVCLPCSHAFHGYCDQKYCLGGLCKWLEENTSCPCCRRTVCA